MTNHPSTGNHAIVFGASGLLGWSVVNELLSNYPEAGFFSRVTAVVNRPISVEGSCLPSPSPELPRLDIVSGVNLGEGSGSDLANDLRERVPGADGITHVFYYVFSAFGDDHIREREINCDMMQRVADAMNILTSSLKSFVYSGGTRGYGIYVPGGTFKAPLREELADQLPEDYVKTVAYPWFRQIMTKASEGREWSWTEVCPDAVVGFSPNGSGFSLALHWAQYLSLFASNNGINDGSTVPSADRVKVPFPGSDQGLDSKFTPVSSRLLGRISIFSALHPESCGGKVVNMMDSDRPTTFRELWPSIAAWFGLDGVGPSNKEDELKPGEYVTKHKQEFEALGRSRALTCGVGAGSGQLDLVGWWLTFDRQLSGERLRSLGFREERDPIEGWIEAFEQFRAAGIIL